MSQFLNDLQAQFSSLPNWGKAAVSVAAGLALYVPYKYLTTRPRSSPYKTDFKPGVVYLYQFPRSSITPNISNYCLKLETWLRIADIPYEIVNIPIFLRSKEGTLPFVELDGIEYYDSSFIIRDLSNVLNKNSIEDHLTEEHKAVSRAFEKMIELSLNMAHMPIRIANATEIMAAMPREVFGVLFPLIISLMGSQMAKKVGYSDWCTPLQYTKSVASSSYGKHSRDDLIQIGCDDLLAISTYLGTKHFFTGFKPTKIDATLFGFLSQIVYAPYENEHTKFIFENTPNIVEYVNRIKSRFWPDWDDCTKRFSTDAVWKKPRANGSAANSRASSRPGSLIHSPRAS